MSPIIVGGKLKRARFPRVSGDEPLRQVKVVGHLEFSPREWG